MSLARLQHELHGGLHVAGTQLPALPAMCQNISMKRGHKLIEEFTIPFSPQADGAACRPSLSCRAVTEGGLGKAKCHARRKA